METGINNLKDLVEVAVWIVGAGSLAFAAYTYYLNQKQLNFAVIVSCTERFQKIMAQLKSYDVEEQQRAIKQYVDLCNEELFYFKNKYLPEEVIDEWLDGMVYYLPHFKGTENVNRSPECLVDIYAQNMLADYPRVKDAFTVDDSFNVKSKNERRKLIAGIKKNLKKSPSDEA